ncbi:MAG TPA: BatA domain-containing protein, partial [Verrucomicrobium sp.]|nr:BatA domain-containing protein [Verrucomicrobium sp.]
MNFLLANPAGLWALLAIPAVLAIHFLQERSRKVRVSTLFLLDRVRPESTGGARFERLRNSVPLWLQLLAALLVTWMLAEPRWIKQDSRQTVVVVLDSSVSMSAFKEPTRDLLADKLRTWTKAAAETEWHLLETDRRKPTLYAGKDLAALLKAYDKWEPVLGSHRPDDALMVAGGLVKEHGIVIYVTDHKAEVSSGVAVLSAAEALDNVGWAGAEVALLKELTPGSKDPVGMKWKVLVRNYSDHAQDREWWVERTGEDGATVAQQSSKINLAPGQTVALAGEFPPDMNRATLVLRGDEFTWDDRLPLQKPIQRIVSLAIQSSSPPGAVARKMITSLEGVEVMTGEAGSLSKPADLAVAELGNPVNTDAIQILGGGGENLPLDGAFTIAEDHPLTRDLNWMGLLTPRPMELSLTDRDEPLLWKGDRPLAILRHDQTPEGVPIRRLLLAWDLSQSNAARHPAMLVLLHRYVERVRLDKLEPWAANFEVNQTLELPATRTGAKARQWGLRQSGAAQEFSGHAPE